MISNCPDVLGFPQELGLEILTKAGFLCDVKKTYPTKPMHETGKWRIVRQTIEANVVILVVAEMAEGIVPLSLSL